MRRPALYVPPGELRAFLEGFSKSDLMELVFDFAAQEVGAELAVMHREALGQVQSESARTVIAEINRRSGSIYAALGRNR